MRDLLLHNFWWKLLSLLLAALTWLTIETTFKKDETLRDSPVIMEGRRTLIIPIRLMTSGANTNDFRLIPPSVEVEVVGSADRMTKLQARDVMAYVNLTDVTTERQLQKEIQIQAPPDIRSESKNPDYVRVERIMPPK